MRALGLALVLGCAPAGGVAWPRLDASSGILVVAQCPDCARDYVAFEGEAPPIVAWDATGAVLAMSFTLEELGLQPGPLDVVAEGRRLPAPTGGWRLDAALTPLTASDAATWLAALRVAELDWTQIVKDARGCTRARDGARVLAIPCPTPSAVAPPAPPEPPSQGPCADGWVSVAEDGAALCVPPPRVMCDATEIQAVGDDRCRPIAVCPAPGTWPAIDGAVYVDEGASAGTGSSAQPYGSIADALDAAPAGAPIVFRSQGERVDVRRLEDHALVGVCPEESKVELSGDAVAPVTLSALSVGARATIVIPDGGALRVERASFAASIQSGAGASLELSGSVMHAGITTSAVGTTRLQIEGSVLKGETMLYAHAMIARDAVFASVGPEVRVESSTVTLERVLLTGFTFLGGGRAKLTMRSVVVPPSGTLHVSAIRTSTKARGGRVIIEGSVLRAWQAHEVVEADDAELVLRDTVLHPPLTGSPAPSGLCLAGRSSLTLERVRMHQGVMMRRKGEGGEFTCFNGTVPPRADDAVVEATLSDVRVETDPMFFDGPLVASLSRVLVVQAANPLELKQIVGPSRVDDLEIRSLRREAPRIFVRMRLQGSVKTTLELSRIALGAAPDTCDAIHIQGIEATVRDVSVNGVGGARCAEDSQFYGRGVGIEFRPEGEDPGLELTRFRVVGMKSGVAGFSEIRDGHIERTAQGVLVPTGVDAAALLEGVTMDEVALPVAQ